MAGLFKRLFSKFSKLFGKKKEIKLGLYGPPNAGKCVTPDTRVLLNSGETIEIKEIFDGVREKEGFFEDEDFEETYIECSNSNIIVPSFDSETLQITPKKVSFVYAQKYKGDVYSIKTRNGRVVKATPNHPLIRISNNGVEKIKSMHLEVGQHVAITKKVALSSSLELSPVTEESFNIDGDMIQSICKYHNPKSITTPNYIDEKYVRFVAYVLSEANHGKSWIKFSNMDMNFIEDFENITNKLFSLKGIRRLNKGVHEVEVNSKTLIEYLETTLGFSPALSGEKKIPSQFMGLNDNLISLFLRVLFDCEAFVPADGKSRGAEIEFSTKSRELSEQVQILLNRFGIVARFKEKVVDGQSYWPLFISGSDNHRRFREKIGFSIDYKQERLDNLCEINACRKKFRLPIMGLLENMRIKFGLTQKEFFLDNKHVARMIKSNKITSSRLKKMSEKQEDEFIGKVVNADVVWDSIVEIKKETYDGFVYDLTIEDTHTFMLANGLIAHNTSLANRVCKDWLGEDISMGSASAVPHETREIQIKDQIKIKKKGKELTFNLVDTPGIATKIDYEDFLKFKMNKKDAKDRAKQATKGVIDAIKWLDDMDAVVVVLDSTINPYSQVNITIIGNLAARDIPVLIAGNKIDLKKADIKKIEAAFPQYKVVGISATKGKNVDAFYDALLKVVK